MSDLQWCTTCDKAIQAYSNSLYCSEECLRQDAINHHPMLGYDFAEFKDFPLGTCRRTSLSPSMMSLSPALSTTSTMTSVSPTLSPLPSTYALTSHQHQRKSSAGSMAYVSSLSDDILHLEPITNTKSNTTTTKYYNSSNTLNGLTTQHHQSSLFHH